MAARSSLASIALATLILIVAAAITQVVGAADKTDGGGNGDIRPRSRDLVVEACKNFSQGDLMGGKLYFNEEMCISVLRSDNRSSAAKDHGDLVVIALDLLSRHNGEAAAKIGEVLRGHAVRNWTERAFRYCDADYGLMMKTLPVCRDIFLDSMKKTQGKQPSFWVYPSDALHCMDKLGMASEDCRIWLAENDFKQTQEFETVVKHASLAWGLMEIALNYLDGSSKW